MRKSTAENIADMVAGTGKWLIYTGVNGLLAWLLYRHAVKGEWAYAAALAFFYLLCALDYLRDAVRESKH